MEWKFSVRSWWCYHGYKHRPCFHDYNCKLQPYTKKVYFFLFYLLLGIWKCSSYAGCGGLVWPCLSCEVSLCVVVEDSSPWFNADPAGHITTGLAASLDTRKHENHWSNYTCSETSFCGGRTEPVNISNCFWLRFQLGSSLSMHG